MGNVKFSALPSASVLGQNDIFCVTQGGVSKQSTISNLWEPTPITDANYTILTTDVLVYTKGAFTAARTWTLPGAAAYGAGRILRVVDAAGTLTGTNTLTLARAGSDTINGATSAVLSQARQAYLLVSDGISLWTIIAIAVSAGAAAGNSFQSFAVSAAGNTNSNATTSNHHVRITVSAGAAAYTATYCCLRAGRAAGDSIHVHFDYAASTNQRMQVFDDTTAGTKLLDFQNDGTATIAWANFTFDGTAWYLEAAYFIA
jgi:hypothetical protein